MTTNVALALPTLTVSDEERAQIKHHLETLQGYKMRNLLKAAYYEGTQRVRNLGISIPPSLRNVEIVVGWPATTVDVLEERLDFLGWADETEALGLAEIYAANGLDVDGSLGHLDALIHGIGFVIVGKGDAGEPDPLITVESPLRVTGDYSGRLRRLSSALSIDEIDSSGNATTITLYGPEEDLTASFRRGVWKVEDRNEHGLGRVGVVPLINKPRASREGGRSEITRAIRSYTDQAVRTLLGMEVNREFYSAPQRYALGADEGAFTDASGNVKTGWELVMGRMLAIPRDEDGELPQVGEFKPASPAPYLAQVEGLAQMVAAEGAIPANYLGFVTENPASADAIRAAEARLIKRAERRQVVFGRAWREVGLLALLVRDGKVPAEYASVSVDWRDAATPTRAAAADEAVKLVGAGVLTPDSPVTLKRLGFSPSEIRQIRSDQRRAQAKATLSALSAAATAAREEEPDVTTEEVPSGGDGA